MSRLTLAQINTLAGLPIQDPLLKAFLTRLLIGYAVGLDYFKACTINGNDIKDRWLLIKDENANELSRLLERDTTLYIPLHPVILKIFEKYNNSIPAFSPGDIVMFLKMLAAEMSKQAQGLVSERVWFMKLYLTFRFSGNGALEMKALGMPVHLVLLVTGFNSNGIYPVMAPEIIDLFFHYFYEFLNPLAAQHGIDGNEVMGLYWSNKI